MELTLADDSTDQRVVTGDEIIVRLEEAPTSGYLWSAQAEGLELLDDRYESPSGARGGTGQRVLRYLAVSQGTVEILASESRPWESRPIRHFHVRIAVRRPS